MIYLQYLKKFLQVMLLYPLFLVVAGGIIYLYIQFHVQIAKILINIFDIPSPEGSEVVAFTLMSIAVMNIFYLTIEYYFPNFFKIKKRK